MRKINIVFLVLFVFLVLIIVADSSIASSSGQQRPVELFLTHYDGFYLRSIPRDDYENIRGIMIEYDPAGSEDRSVRWEIQVVNDTTVQGTLKVQFWAASGTEDPKDVYFEVGIEERTRDGALIDSISKDTETRTLTREPVEIGVDFSENEISDEIKTIEEKNLLVFYLEPHYPVSEPQSDGAVEIFYNSSIRPSSISFSTDPINVAKEITFTDKIFRFLFTVHDTLGNEDINRSVLSINDDIVPVDPISSLNHTKYQGQVEISSDRSIIRIKFVTYDNNGNQYMIEEQFKNHNTSDDDSEGISIYLILLIIAIVVVALVLIKRK